jgi:hypothetical protein
VRLLVVEMRPLPLRHPLRAARVVLARTEVDRARPAEFVVMVIVSAMHGRLS